MTKEEHLCYTMEAIYTYARHAARWLGTFLTFSLLLINVIDHKADAARVEVNGVVNPVKTDGLLSISCQIWDLNKDDQVTFFRQIKDRTQTLSVNQDILSDVDDNVFLATRTMADGSVVFFLTIMHVALLDAGEYWCKVSTVMEILAIDSVHVDVLYFPDDTSPRCSPNILPVVHEGVRLRLNCTSDAGNPDVKMQWRFSDNLLNSSPVSNNGVLYSELHITASWRRHNNKIFICSISHPAFPDKLQTCHLGPLRVIPNGGNAIPDDEPETGDSIIPATISAPFTMSSATDPSSRDNENTRREQCAEVCSQSSSTFSFQWKIATLIAVATAVVFMVCGCLLFVTLKTVDRPDDAIVMHHHGGEGVAVREQLYTELSNKFDESKVYIALERQARKELPMASRNDSLTSDFREPRKY